MSEKSFSLEQLAKLTGALPVGDLNARISGVADLESATPDDLTFLANARYGRALKNCKAGAIFIEKESDELKGNTNLLLHPNPSEAFQKALELFFDKSASESGFTGVHPTAVIHPTAKIAADVQIGPYAVIDQNCTISERTIIGAHCYIGSGCSIGTDCYLYPRVTLREGCILQNRVILQPGAVIGSCGFGYITDHSGEHRKLEQFGNVLLEDDVEVGANSTIDRARFKTTKIGKGSKIDNQVQIGHGVELGAHNILVSQSGIAGSTKTGRYVVLGAKAGVAGHLRLDDHVRIAALAGVSKSLSSGDYNGIPAQPIAEYNRNTVYLRNIGKWIEKIKSITQSAVRETS